MTGTFMREEEKTIESRYPSARGPHSPCRRSVRDAAQVADQGEDLVDVVRATPARREGGIPSSPWVQAALSGNPSRFTPRVAQARRECARFVGALGAGAASLLADAPEAGDNEGVFDLHFTGRRPESPARCEGILATRRSPGLSPRLRRCPEEGSGRGRGTAKPTPLRARGRRATAWAGSGRPSSRGRGGSLGRRWRVR